MGTTARDVNYRQGRERGEEGDEGDEGDKGETGEKMKSGLQYQNRALLQEWPSLTVKVIGELGLI